MFKNTCTLVEESVPLIGWSSIKCNLSNIHYKYLLWILWNKLQQNKYSASTKINALKNCWNMKWQTCLNSVFLTIVYIIKKQEAIIVRSLSQLSQWYSLCSPDTEFNVTTGSWCINYRYRVSRQGNGSFKIKHNFINYLHICTKWLAAIMLEISDKIKISYQTEIDT